MSSLDPYTLKSIATKCLERAWECDGNARKLKMPAGSAEHLAANVWRAAAVMISPEITGSALTDKQPT